MNGNYMRQAMARFAKVVNLPMVKQNKSGSIGMEVAFQGFPYDSYNRAGYIDFWKASKFAEVDRISTAQSVLKAMPQGSMSIIVSTVNHLHQALHEQGTMTTKLRYMTDITEVGRTSLVNCTRILSNDTNEILVTCYRKLVTIDVKQRVPVPLNQQFVDQCEQDFKLQKDVNFKPYPKKVQPSIDNLRLCHVSTVKVPVSDTDLSFHTNQAAYLKFCLDAAYEAVTLGQVRGFSGDLAFYPCNESQSLYKMESFAGDELNVSVYQEPEGRCDNKLYFIITFSSRDGKKSAGEESLVCFHTMTFHDCVDQSR